MNEQLAGLATEVLAMSVPTQHLNIYLTTLDALLHVRWRRYGDRSQVLWAHALAAPMDLPGPMVARWKIMRALMLRLGMKADAGDAFPTFETLIGHPLYPVNKVSVRAAYVQRMDTVFVDYFAGLHLKG